jgi:peptidylprolyl isomerase
VSHKFVAHVYTTSGHFIVELMPGIAPEHVNSFVFLGRERFFNGTVFHRVEPGFVVQGGDPTGTGTGGPGYTVPLEASEEPFARGVVGMARSQDPDSAGSQWFVTLGDAPHLNGEYTVFGKVVEGMEFVDCIEVGDRIIDLAIQEN